MHLAWSFTAPYMTWPPRTLKLSVLLACLFQTSFKVQEKGRLFRCGMFTEAPKVQSGGLRAPQVALSIKDRTGAKIRASLFLKRPVGLRAGYTPDPVVPPGHPYATMSGS